MARSRWVAAGGLAILAFLHSAVSHEMENYDLFDGTGTDEQYTVSIVPSVIHLQALQVVR
jgi:hypothetical protein